MAIVVGVPTKIKKADSCMLSTITTIAPKRKAIKYVAKTASTNSFLNSGFLNRLFFRVLKTNPPILA